MSKVYGIGLQRYRDCDIIVCGKDSIPLTDLAKKETRVQVQKTE